jgi:hypothetical protein
MYKIDQISSLVENIEIERTKELPPEFIEFAKSLISIEKEFQKIDPKYNIEITPTRNTFYDQFRGSSLMPDDAPEPNYNETILAFTLKYENTDLFSETTHVKFEKYKELENYVERIEFPSSLFNHDGLHLVKTVSIQQEPDLFKQIIEDKLIKSFLDNEKKIKSVNEVRDSLKLKM